MPAVYGAGFALCFAHSSRGRPQAAPLTASGAAAPWTPAGLHGRTGHGPERAVDAAIAGFGAQHRVTPLAFVEPLACIGGHGFRRGVSAFRACERGFETHVAHGLPRTTVERNPACSVACVMAPRFTLASSKTTVVSRFDRFDWTPRTPSSRVSAFFTVMGQAAQFIAGIESVTACCAARAGAATAAMASKTRTGFTRGPFFNRTREPSRESPRQARAARPRRRRATCAHT